MPPFEVFKRIIAEEVMPLVRTVLDENRATEEATSYKERKIEALTRLERELEFKKAEDAEAAARKRAADQEKSAAEALLAQAIAHATATQDPHLTTHIMRVVEAVKQREFAWMEREEHALQEATAAANPTQNPVIATHIKTVITAAQQASIAERNTTAPTDAAQRTAQNRAKAEAITRRAQVEAQDATEKLKKKRAK